MYVQREGRGHRIKVGLPLAAHELHHGGGRLILLVELDEERAQARGGWVELPAAVAAPPSRPADDRARHQEVQARHAS